MNKIRGLKIAVSDSELALLIIKILLSEGCLLPAQMDTKGLEKKVLKSTKVLFAVKPRGEIAFIPNTKAFNDFGTSRLNLYEELRYD